MFFIAHPPTPHRPVSKRGYNVVCNLYGGRGRKRAVDASTLPPEVLARRLDAIDNFFAEPETVKPFHADDLPLFLDIVEITNDIRLGRGDVLQNGDPIMKTTTQKERGRIYELAKLYE
jgi:hypothetical protein